MSMTNELSKLPPDLEEADIGMSNFDHSIDHGLAKLLKQRKHFCHHSAWNFNALVWWDGEHFISEIWQYHKIVDYQKAESLEELMEIANEKWGSD